MACMSHECIWCGHAWMDNAQWRMCPQCGHRVTNDFDEPMSDHVDDREDRDEPLDGDADDD